MSATQTVPMVPEEIAAAVVLPESYRELDSLVYPAARWLRENMPVGRVEIEPYPPFWVIAKNADIVSIMRDKERFDNEENQPVLMPRAALSFIQETTWENPPTDGSETRIMLDFLSAYDEQKHRLHRYSLNPYFSAAHIRDAFDAEFRRIADTAVTEFLEHDGECDFLAELASPYPARIIMAMLGVPPEDERLVLDWTREFFGNTEVQNQRPQFHGLPDAAARNRAAAFEDLREYFRELKPPANPNSLFHVIRELKMSNGESWSESSALSFLSSNLPAGHDPVTASLTGGMLGLCRFPDQLQAVQRDPELVAGLVEESLRYTSTGLHFGRHVRYPNTEFKGVEMNQGEFVMCLLLSGNRDEDVFDNPDAFDVTRRPNRHVAFGGGVHVCLGQHLTKVQMQVLFEDLLPKLKSVELVEEPTYTADNLAIGFNELKIRFERA